MCGIAGLLDLERRSGTQELEALGRAMAATLNHRGPDAMASGLTPRPAWRSAIRGSPSSTFRRRARSRWCRAAARCVITYNGEIYNAGDLRPELEARGRRFRGHSDTEVLVEAFAEWGVKATVERLIGMFAFALWDRRSADA